MTKKQLTALRRILEREAADYQVRSGRPAPGQHPSENKVAVSDGNICVLLGALLPEFPVGERADTFSEIVRKERECETHLPVSAEQIKISAWKKQAELWAGQADDPGIELTVPACRTQLSADPMVPGRAISNGDANPVVAHFNPQLLVDAAEAVGGKPQFFLGMGRFNSRYPSLLVFPPNWMEQSECGPIALVLPRRT